MPGVALTRWLGDVLHLGRDAGVGMTKSDLIRAVAEKMDHLLGRDVEVVVNTLFHSMVEALQRGERIEIRGFGSFTVRERSARQGRNPRNGHEIDVPAKRMPFFTVGQALRTGINTIEALDAPKSLTEES